MHAVEFTTELKGTTSIAIPEDIAARLPKSGQARVIVLMETNEDREWRLAGYEQFLREDPPEDSVYDKLR